MMTAFKAPSARSHPSASVRRLLIVDGDPAAALVTQRGLQLLLGAAVEVEIAPSAGAARLRCAREQLDLLIVDPAPHDGAAWALLKVLHEQCPAVPILVLTAYDTIGLRAKMHLLGVRHYLAKPATLQELEQAVRAAVGLDVLVS